MALTIPNILVAHTVASAGDVNANFAAIAAYINGSVELSSDHASDVALLPKGKMGATGYVAVTANQAGIGGVVDITSLTLTNTFLASRYYRITGFCGSVTSTTVTDRFTLSITDATPTQIAASAIIANTQMVVVQAIVQPGAGSKLYKLRGQTTGAGTTTFNASATTPAFLLIEDIGL